MCAVMDVHPSGYYAWRREPIGEKRRDDKRLLGLLKQAWLESGCVYGYRKLTLDMRDLGEQCGKHRVARLLRCEGIRSQTGYRRRSSARGGKPAVVAPNHLNRQFTPDQPNRSWVTDITYIRTHEGWLYLAVVLDLFNREVVGWSLKPRMTTDIVIDALDLVQHPACYEEFVIASGDSDFTPLLQRLRAKAELTADLLEAARRLGAAPSACLYVGDDERDIVAGLGADVEARQPE
mgnify:CR=1 FL=1